MYMHTHTQTHVHTHTYMYIYADTCTDTCTDTHIHTHTYKKLVLCCSLTEPGTEPGGGREHSTHSFLCFHCAQLLSSLMASSANDRSGLSSEPAQQDGPGGHTRAHHNFHSPLASRRVEISRPAL
ncbi:unnamed protein product, partial [Staurois parvus]